LLVYWCDQDDKFVNIFAVIYGRSTANNSGNSRCYSLASIAKKRGFPRGPVDSAAAFRWKNSKRTVASAAQQQQECRVPPVVVIDGLIGLSGLALWHRILRLRN
jgi:hypothetical protein